MDSWQGNESDSRGNGHSFVEMLKPAMTSLCLMLIHSFLSPERVASMAESLRESVVRRLDKNDVTSGRDNPRPANSDAPSGDHTDDRSPATGAAPDLPPLARISADRPPRGS